MYGVGHVMNLHDAMFGGLFYLIVVSILFYLDKKRCL